tara:strand:+ start:244 stop:1065 length:822 start_codon:yes stop_codon:yes gene_type:complete
MSCNVCESDYGYTNGCGCSFLMCESCSKRTCKEKDKCPQCSKSIKTPYFLSGKISAKTGQRAPVEYNPKEARLIVYDDGKDTKQTVMETIAGSKHGIISLYSSEQLIKYSDFIDKDKSLPIRSINQLTSITGPCIIVNGDIHCGHGCSVNGDYEDYSSLYRDISLITHIVEKRNREMIEKCRVFSLKVNCENDCFCSFSEWGYAMSLNKTLILDISKRNPKLKEYYMYAVQSLDSLEKLKFTRKHSIIKYHPDLEFNDYNSYKGFMMHIISIK